MAKQNTNGVQGAIQGPDDGFLYVRGLEDNSLQRYIETYGGEIGGYKTTPGDMFTNVTMKVSFPAGTSESNANLWAYFIALAAHASCSKPRIKTFDNGSSVVAFVTWPIWNNVRYTESKRKDADRW